MRAIPCRPERRLAPALVAGLLLAPAVGAGPLPTRNENPLLAPFGVPNVLPARLPTAGSDEAGLTLNWSNSITVETAGDASFHMDAEAQEWRLDWIHAFTDRVAVRAELPWRRLGGGSLDSAIEQWHDLWGLPNGDRDKVPQDDLRIEYGEGSRTLLQVANDTSGLGDIPLSVGYQLAADDQRAVAAWLTLKAPTGQASDLSGSGALDVALSVAAEWQFLEHWQWFGQADLTWLGDGDVLTARQRHGVGSAMTGLTWNAWRGLDLTVQLDANSSVFDAPTHVAGDALVLGFGGSYRTEGGWRFDLGFGEDLTVDAAPDFTIVFGARRGF